VKFTVKKLNRNSDNGEDANTNGSYTTAINAQGDIRADCSATNAIDIIHNYVEFPIPQEVGVFSEDENGKTLQSLGEGMIKIISDQGSIINWSEL
jgi:hypothetical protein